MMLLVPLVLGLTVSQQPPSGFTRVAGHHIQGHDGAGVFVLDHEHSTVTACAQNCNNNRGCMSFEFGVDGAAAQGDCLLSYDTRATVDGRGVYTASSLWDYYERDSSSSTLSNFNVDTDSWLPGEDTAGIFLNVSVEAC